MSANSESEKQAGRYL